MITLHFQFELYHIVVELSFLCSNQPCIIVTFLVFLFLADQIFYRCYINRRYVVFFCGPLHRCEEFFVFYAVEKIKDCVGCVGLGCLGKENVRHYKAFPESSVHIWRLRFIFHLLWLYSKSHQISPFLICLISFVFMWRHHFPKLQISNPTGVLVSSDIKPYQNLSFNDV